MKKLQCIFEQGDHRWDMIARDPQRQGYVIDTNEYLITNGDAALLTDPGGMEIFPAVFSALTENVDPNSIQYIFASHQDPDIISSLSLWLDFNADIRCYISWLWQSFVPHFGGDNTTFLTLPDEGKEFTLNGLGLEAIPAHHLHSAGNFHLYDAKAGILFTGDVGAALLPRGDTRLFVDDFDNHIKYAEKFHKRWMGSNQAKRDWCERVGSMKIDMLCPQHGAIYKGEDVQRFINWFDELEVGVW